MEELLEELFSRLRQTFENQLSVKDLKCTHTGDIDVFKTYVSLSKSQKDFRKLIESSARNKESLELEFSKAVVKSALSDKFIRNGSTINSDKIFICSNGLYHYYRLRKYNLNNVFIEFDNSKFVQEKLKLKTQEKIWCIFLILFDAVSQDKILDTTKLKPRILNQYFQFFELIEVELHNYGLNIGKKIGWGTGKDVNFRKFITNNVALPNSGIYNDRPTSKYWLDFSNRKNVAFILDLILDSYTNEERILANNSFIEVLRHLSNQMLPVLQEFPRELNKYLKDDLSS